MQAKAHGLYGPPQMQLGHFIGQEADQLLLANYLAA